MSLYESNARLERSVKDLQRHWRQTSEFWRDSQAARLERELVDPLVVATRQANEAILRLQQAVNEARRDCS